MSCKMMNNYQIVDLIVLLIHKDIFTFYDYCPKKVEI